MAEIKNSFLKSKMNKDLDDRILTNGEYRDANNISVGRSEDSDVGALENIVGNLLVTNTDLAIANLEVIGSFSDDGTNQIFIFLTDYTGTAFSPANKNHFIYVYNTVSGDYTLLVQGFFLNFDINSPIYGINLLEELLFWTDNRNQPRKINIAKALQDNTYYNTEDQISVAKYNPYNPISLIKQSTATIATVIDTTSVTVAGDVTASITPGMTLTSTVSGREIDGSEYIFVASSTYNAGTSSTTIVISSAPANAFNAGDVLLFSISTMTNKSSDATWPGDPNYLEDKFVRFSYRFKFDDGEYSLMAPFTQIAYIPTQKGYFVQGDQDAAFRSTVLDFMQNNVQNIVLNIELPDTADRISSTYKITEIDLLFKESDALIAKVLETVLVSNIAVPFSGKTLYSYEYQSRKPYKTLLQAQTTRVYDKVPVRALAQESAGNRIIYANYFDKHTPPETINYNCAIVDKSSTGVFNNFIEYPNHSVKQNRTYQIGFILSDKYGRSSPVILSEVDTGVTTSSAFFSGSTIYNPYNTTFQDMSLWFGDAMQVVVNNIIDSTLDTTIGTPGLYAQPVTGLSSGVGYAAKPGTTVITGTATAGTYEFASNTTPYPNNLNVPVVGNYLRGYFEDFVEVKTVSIVGGVYDLTTSGRVSDIYQANATNIPDLKFAYTLNPTGWYSYKVVVKQQEQEYYNCYLPGILNGYPGQSTLGKTEGNFPASEINVTAHTVLLNDNINKIPRDLTEVGPDQKQYRSSVQLFGRVFNNTQTSNIQYFPNITGNKNALSHTASTIATAGDLNMGFLDLSDDTGTNANGQAINGDLVFYQLDTNPLVARISTLEKSIGMSALSTSVAVDNMTPYLAVYETEPVTSLLDIYWETTTVGLIADLNADIQTGFEGATSFGPMNWSMREFCDSNGSQALATGAPGSPWITDYFSAFSNEGTALIDTSIASFTVTNGLGTDVSGSFRIDEGTGADLDKFRIRIGQNFTFIDTSAINDVFDFSVTVNALVSGVTIPGVITFQESLVNIVPGAPGNLTGSTPLSVAPYEISRASTIVVPTSVYSTLNNGGADILGEKNKQQLLFSITAGNPQGALGNDLWTINSLTGEVTQIANSVPNGLYTGFTIRIQDANGGTGFLEQSIILRITVGAAALNSRAISPCRTNLNTNNLVANIPTNAVAFNMATPRVGQGTEGSQGVTACWFLSNYDLNTFTPEGVNGGVSSLPASFSATADNKATTDASGGTNAYWLGEAGNQQEMNTGNVAISLNVGMKNDGTSNPRALWDSFIVYHYNGTTNAWEETEDLNGSLSKYSTSAGTTTPTLNYLENFGGASSSTFNYFQLIKGFAYSQFTPLNNPKGNFAIVIKNLRFTGVSSQASSPFAWVNTDDLYNPSCVIWQGANVIDTWANSYFPYLRSASASGFTCNTNVGSDALYANTPYGEFVEVFFTDNALTLPFNGASGFYNFELNRSGFTTVPASWQTNQGTDVELRWGARILSTGQKQTNLGGNITGDNHARPTTTGTNNICQIGSTVPSGTAPSFYGAVRIFQN